MQIDRKALDSLLSLDDKTLMAIISRLANENGVKMTDININPSDISSIRQAIAGASDADLEALAKQFGKK